MSSRGRLTASLNSRGVGGVVGGGVGLREVKGQNFLQGIVFPEFSESHHSGWQPSKCHMY